MAQLIVRVEPNILPCTNPSSVCICRECILSACPRICSDLIGQAHEDMKYMNKGNRVDVGESAQRFSEYLHGIRQIERWIPPVIPPSATWFAYSMSHESLSIAERDRLMHGPYNTELRELDGGNIHRVITTGGNLDEYAVRLGKYRTAGAKVCDVTEWNLYRELAHELRGDVARAFFPDVYAATGNGLVYMEHINGMKLSNAIASYKILTTDLVLIYAMLHGLLAYLYRKIGFIHGKLVPSNIILRGMGKSYVHNVPIIREDDSVLWVEMPYQPVLIGLERATTHKCSRLTNDCTPYMSELADIVHLYTSVPECHYDRTGRDKTKQNVKRLLWAIVGGVSSPGKLGTPYVLPIVCDQVSHSTALHSHLETIQRLEILELTAKIGEEDEERAARILASLSRRSSV